MHLHQKVRIDTIRGRRSPVKMKAESVGKKDGGKTVAKVIKRTIGFVERVSVGVKTSSDLVCTGW